MVEQLALWAVTSRPRRTTHSDKCWRWHHDCAVVEVLELREELRVAWDAAADADDDTKLVRQQARLDTLREVRAYVTATETGLHDCCYYTDLAFIRWLDEQIGETP